VPKSFVKVVALGDTVSLWLDGPSGCLFASDNVREPTGEERIGFSFWAPSVIEWIEHALIGPLFSYGAERQPRVALTHLATATDVPETSPMAPGIQAEAVQAHSLSSSEADTPEQTAPYAHAHAQNVQQRLERAATRLRLERQAQRLVLIREEVVRLLGEAADVQHNVLEEVKVANLAERGWGDVGLQYFAEWADKMQWGKAALQALADTEAQLFNMEWNIPWVD
jgi:hypothetical protein